MKKAISIVALVGLFIGQFGYVPHAEAAVSSWQKSFSIIPQGTEDYSSASFQQSLRNLKADGANYVNLIIPYYQSNSGSTDIGRGWNTPSDSSLISAIQYAHSIGLHVSIALYLETYSGEWRAVINPGDRDTWYRNYGNTLVYYGRLGQQYGVEQFVLGAELISMASANTNSDNTQRWNTMIANVRAVYSGALSYSANRGEQDHTAWGAELPNIGFWDKLDLIGVSGYYGLFGDGSVASLESDWQGMNDYDINPIHQKYPTKPIIFTEIGYRSVDNAHSFPWDSGMSGNYNSQEQINDYTALFDYWNKYSYMTGVDMWWWKSNPNAGGAGDTDYTPQNKPAEQTLKQWWLSGTTPSNPPPSSVTFSTSAGAPATATVGQTVQISANVTETAGSTSGTLVDLEVYQGGTRVYQTFQGGQNFSQGQTKTFGGSFMPNSAGTYTFKIGVFTGDWSKTYSWNDSAATITVSAGSQPPPSTPPPSGSSVTNIWWPSDGSHVTGTQPFKAMVSGLDVSQYTMYWSVDGGARVQMYNSSQDYPHKEALVDLSGWHWKGAGPYTITFTSTNSSGTAISTKSINIYTQ